MYQTDGLGLGFREEVEPLRICFISAVSRIALNGDARDLEAFDADDGKEGLAGLPFHP
jgi:hypothetical protein